MIVTQNLPLSLAKLLTYVGGAWGVIAAWLSLLGTEHLPVSYLFYGLFIVLPMALFWFLGKVKTMTFPVDQQGWLPVILGSLFGSVGCLLFFAGGFMLVRIVIGGEDFEEGKRVLIMMMSTIKVLGMVVVTVVLSMILKRNIL